MKNFNPPQGSTAASDSGPRAPTYDLGTQQGRMESLMSHGLPILTPEDTANLNAMCASLANTIVVPDYSKDTLLRHAHMLNEMFYKMMGRLTQSVPKFETGYEGTAVAALNMQIQQRFTILALQVQRQCADALRAAHAIDYMQSLTEVNNLALNADTPLAAPEPHGGGGSPHPLPVADQTEGQ